MASITPFPTPSVSGPVINKMIIHPVDYKTNVHLFDDGGADVDVLRCGPKRFDLEYDGLSESDASILDAHFALAKGKTNTFDFFDQRNGVTYPNARYDRYEVDRHEKYWSLARRITIVVED